MLHKIIDKLRIVLDNAVSLTMSNLQNQAIQASLQKNWEIAIELNNAILEETPHDIATLNRLARAYTELGQKDSAATVYRKVLELDKYNPIASKNLRLLPSLSGNSESTISKNEDFVEEVGITKTVTLVKSSDKTTLLSLNCKQLLALVPRARLVAVSTEQGQYIGSFPDDISAKLKKNLKSGYKYTICLKSTSENKAAVFIREIHRPNRVNALPTFTTNGKY